MNDASKVKNEVWKIVKAHLNDAKQSEVSYQTKKGDKWNPTRPPAEPPELAKIFRLNEDTFTRYLDWYDMKRAGCSFRTIAAKNNKGESAVRRGFDIIYEAIERNVPPAKEQDIITDFSPKVEKYNCPYHPFVCPGNCTYRKRWEEGFNKAYPEITEFHSLETKEYKDAFRTSAFVKKKRKSRSPQKQSNR